jgi:hypothetical protein
VSHGGTREVTADELVAAAAGMRDTLRAKVA